MQRAGTSKSPLYTLDDAATRLARASIAQSNATQAAEVQGVLGRLAAARRTEEERLTQGFKMRDKLLWERIEAVIKQEETKARKAWEQSEAARQQEAKRKAEEEAKAKVEAEKRQKDEAEAKARAKAQADATAKKKVEEKRKAEMEQKAKESQVAEAARRDKLGQSTALDEWRQGRAVLHVSAFVRDFLGRLTRVLEN